MRRGKMFAQVNSLGPEPDTGSYDGLVARLCDWSSAFV